MNAPPAELALFGLFRPRSTSPGFAIPVFGDSTDLWVQEVGDSGQVVRFVRCDVQATKLLTAPMKITNEPWVQRVGEQPIFAFQMPDQHVEVGTREMLAEPLRIVAPQLSAYSFVSLDAAEFLGDKEREREARKACADLLKVRGVGADAKFNVLRDKSFFPNGFRLDRYELVSQLGSGGMGSVYLARDTQLDRRVALKILPADIKSDLSRTRHLAEEARAAAAINNPHISQIYEIGEAEGTNFIAMELIEGQTLRERMRQSQIEVGEALDIASQIASALSAVEAAGIVHRDLKPENIMLQQNGIVKVLDFGLAKALAYEPREIDREAQTSDLQDTKAGQVIGTPFYMSPEQAQGLAVDSRTDIWALGVVLYEMLSGHVPFEGGSTLDTLFSILKLEPVPLARYSQVPDEIERIVNRALRKAPEDRYQKAQDMAFDLKNLRTQYEVGDDEVHPVRPTQGVLAVSASSGYQAATSGARESDSRKLSVQEIRSPAEIGFAVTVCKILGVVFLMIGIASLVAPDLLSAHLTPSLKLVHIFSGVLAIYFGFAGSLSGARIFAITLGIIYATLGTLGLVLGESENNRLWEVGPLQLVTIDHGIHLLLGAVFLAGGLFTKKIRRS